MFTALSLIGLSIWGKIDDELKKKKEKEELERKILETKEYEIRKRELNTTSCYEFIKK